MFSFRRNPPAPAPDTPEESKASWTERLKAGLAKTRGQLGSLFRGAKIDDELLEELETTLLLADCGIEATHWLLAELKARVKRDRLESAAQLRQALMDLLQELLAPLEQ